MEALGIDLYTLIVQIVNFGLLLFILKKVLFKPVMKAILVREKKLSEIEAREMLIAKKENESDEKRKKELLEAQKEKTELLSNTKNEAEKARKEIIEKANIEAKNTIKKATQEADKIIVEAEKSIDEKAFDLASVMVQKVLSESLDTATQKKVVENAVRQLKEIKA